MSTQKKYEWFIIVEGTDDKIYREYLAVGNEPGLFNIVGEGGKDNILNMDNGLSPNIIKRLIDLTARDYFKGIIFVVDSDKDANSAFKGYRRSRCVEFDYIGEKPEPALDSSKTFWMLDSFYGTNKILHIRGLTVPHLKNGCLETALLLSYGFPVNPQPEYETFLDIVKKATCKWNIPAKDDGNLWYEDDKKDDNKSQIDKFIYTALRRGFEAIMPPRKKIGLPPEPEIIKNIRMAMTDINGTNPVI